jgi:hypothetical protein
MKKMIQRVEENNYLENPLDSFIPLVIQGLKYGYLSDSTANRLSLFRETFIFKEAGHQKFLYFTPELEQADSQTKTAAISKVTSTLRDEGYIKGWRNELVPVSRSFSSEVAFSIERAAYPLFGIKGYGVHVNGFCRDNDDDNGSIKLWVAKRSQVK